MDPFFAKKKNPQKAPVSQVLEYMDMFLFIYIFQCEFKYAWQNDALQIFNIILFFF
jgi:hypothetical protein